MSAEAKPTTQDEPVFACGDDMTIGYDDYYDPMIASFSCDLPKGHEGDHRTETVTCDDSPRGVVLSWRR